MRNHGDSLQYGFEGPACAARAGRELHEGSRQAAEMIAHAWRNGPGAAVISLDDWYDGCVNGAWDVAKQRHAAETRLVAYRVNDVRDSFYGFRTFGELIAATNGREDERNQICPRMTLIAAKEELRIPKQIFP